MKHLIALITIIALSVPCLAQYTFIGKGEISVNAYDDENGLRAYGIPDSDDKDMAYILTDKDRFITVVCVPIIDPIKLQKKATCINRATGEVTNSPWTSM